MKRSRTVSAVVLFILSGCVTGAQCADLKADSRITGVTVYPGAALVSRAANVKVDSGPQKIVFTDIISDIDPNSLRTSASGTADAMLYGAELKTEHVAEEAYAEVTRLEKEIEAKQDEVRSLENAKGVLREDKAFLDSVRLYANVQIPKDLVTKMPLAADLDNMLKFLDGKYKENFAQAADYDIKIREINKKIEALQRELAKYSSRSYKTKKSIFVDMEVAKPGDLEVIVSYLVKGATWEPLYDARAQFDRNEVDLSSYAVLAQKTGDDWKDVAISISTANTSMAGRLPEAESWVLRPYRPVYRTENRLAYDQKLMMKEANRAMAPQTASYDTVEGAEVNKAAKEVHAQIQETVTAVQYSIPRKSTIMSDGEGRRLPLAAQKLSAVFEYWAYPRAIQTAFLAARVRNAKDQQLLPGRINVFFENEFVGTSILKAVAPNEEFDLYLGADQNVKVKRELVEKKVDETIIGNIPGLNKKTVYNYKMTVENFKSKKIKLNLLESMPVPEDDRIKVKIENASVELRDQDWKDKKGVWRWVLDLNPKEKKEITYSYTIEHPKDMNVQGL